MEINLRIQMLKTEMQFVIKLVCNFKSGLVCKMIPQNKGGLAR